MKIHMLRLGLALLLAACVPSPGEPTPQPQERVLTAALGVAACLFYVFLTFRCCYHGGHSPGTVPKTRSKN